MKKSMTFIAIFFVALSHSELFVAAPDAYGPFKYDGGCIACDQDTGPEI